MRVGKMAFWVFCQWLNIKRPRITHQHIICDGLPALKTCCVGNVMRMSRKLFGKHYIETIKSLWVTACWRDVVLSWGFKENGTWNIPMCQWCYDLSIYQREYKKLCDICGWFDEECCKYEDLIYVHKENGKCECKEIDDAGRWSSEVARYLQNEGFCWVWTKTKVVIFETTLFGRIHAFVRRRTGVRILWGIINYFSFLLICFFSGSLHFRHVYLCLLCLHIPFPLHCLHTYLRIPCSHISLPLHNLHMLLRFLCLHIPFPLHVLHLYLTLLCLQKPTPET